MKRAKIIVGSLWFLLFVMIFLTIPTTQVVKEKPVKLPIKIIKKSAENSIRILAALGERKYVVQKNDSINAIAVKFWVLPKQLMTANRIKDPSHVIHEGDVLIIPNVRWKTEYGLASWYGKRFHGKPMANGRIYDMFDLHIIAHRGFPLNSLVRLTDEATGKSIVVKSEDRGPFTKGPNGNFLRQVDLSYAGAVYFGSVEKGTIYLKIEPLGMTL